MTLQVTTMGAVLAVVTEVQQRPGARKLPYPTADVPARMTYICHTARRDP